MINSSEIRNMQAPLTISFSIPLGNAFWLHRIEMNEKLLLLLLLCSNNIQKETTILPFLRSNFSVPTMEQWATSRLFCSPDTIAQSIQNHKAQLFIIIIIINIDSFLCVQRAHLLIIYRSLFPNRYPLSVFQTVECRRRPICGENNEHILERNKEWKSFTILRAKYLFAFVVPYFGRMYNEYLALRARTLQNKILT